MITAGRASLPSWECERVSKQSKSLTVQKSRRPDASSKIVIPKGGAIYFNRFFDMFEERDSTGVTGFLFEEAGAPPELTAARSALATHHLSLIHI